jgi:hypothetical protein
MLIIYDCKKAFGTGLRSTKGTILWSSTEKVAIYIYFFFLRKGRRGKEENFTTEKIYHVTTFTILLYVLY